MMECGRCVRVRRAGVRVVGACGRRCVRAVRAVRRAEGARFYFV